MPHKVALIDDHELMRSGLAAMIDGLDGYAVSCQASNGREFISMLKHLREPSIAVVDLQMPIMDGYETIGWIKENRPSILPLALTFDASDDAMVKAIRRGARGFMLKSERPKAFKAALDSLLLTGYYHSAETEAMMKTEVAPQTQREKNIDFLLSKITPRELEFLRLVCLTEELTYEEIGKKMGVHRRTVDNYRIGLFEKFAIKSKAGLVLFAVRCGLVEAGE